MRRTWWIISTSSSRSTKHRLKPDQLLLATLLTAPRRRSNGLAWNMKLIAISTVLAVLIVGAGCRVASKFMHEASVPPEDRGLRERNRVYEFMIKLTSSDTESRNHAGDDLKFKELSDSSVHLLVQLLTDAFRVGDPDVQWRAMAHLAYVGPRASPALPFLMEQAHSENAGFRAGAAFALEHIGPDAREAIPALILMLDDKNEHVRASSASALRVFGSDARDAVPRLIRNLSDSYFVARSSAADALGMIGPAAKDAVPHLIKVIEQQKGDPVRSALWALDRIGPAARQAVPVIITMLDHGNRGLRLAAIDALGSIRPTEEDVVHQLAARIVHKDMELNHHIARAMERIGRPAVHTFVKVVTGENAELRVLAIRSLGNIGPDAKQAIPALTGALDDHRAAGPISSAASAPRTVGDWARIALDKIEQKEGPPNQSLKATGEPAP
ncbi:MAG: hypothetical protein C0404_13895 [Verrucomicrobia bacterium]|nr:hypothetical protein [Verrucomicrobiota bacterium]